MLPSVEGRGMPVTLEEHCTNAIVESISAAVNGPHTAAISFDDMFT